MQQDTNNDYLPNKFNTKDRNENGLLQKAIKDPFKTFTFIITLYPIIPLALLSMLVTVIGFGGVIQEFFTRGISLRQALGYTGLLIWLLGGTAGLVGLFRIQRNKINIPSLLLIIYGAFSYTALAAMVIMANLNRPDFMSIMHAAYFAFSLVIIAMLIIKTGKTVLINRSKNKAEAKVIVN